jgi:hypothetical protein
MTRVVHCKRERYEVYIGRPSKWGNPFQIGRDGTRARVIARYREYLMGRPDLLAAIVPELRGKTLACWCAPLACHGDVLAELADADTGAQRLWIQGEGPADRLQEDRRA